MGKLENLIKNMTIREKAAQLVMQEIKGFNTINEPYISLIKDNNITGFIYLTTNNIRKPEELAEFTYYLQQKSKGSNLGIPLLISIDQEGGQLHSLINSIHHPGNMAIGESKKPIEYAKFAGYMTSKQLYDAGIALNFAPVVDILYDSHIPYPDNRSFGSDPVFVTQLASAFCKAHEKNHVATCIKHFPGQRILPFRQDTHFELDIIDYPLKRLENVEFYPFKELAKQNVASIMAGHCIYKVIDEKYPASLSKKLLTDIVRNKWNYNGLLITDDIGMGAIKRYFSFEDSIVLSINAGIDIVLSMGEYIDVTSIIEKAVINKKISEERLNNACLNVLKFKEKWINKNFKPKKSKFYFNTPEFKEKVQQISDDSIILYKNSKNLIPIKNLNEKYILIIHPVFHRLFPADQSNFAIPDFNKIIPEYTKNFHVSAIGLEPTETEVDSIFDLIEWPDIIIILSMNAFYFKKQQQLIQRIIEEKQDKVITASLRSPSDVKYYEKTNTHFIMFGHTEYQIHSLMKAITGKITPKTKINLKL